MWGRIVFGTDGSPAANRAGEVAATIARATSARLIATSGYRASSIGAEERLGVALDAAEAAGMRRAKLEAEAVPGRAGDVLVGVAEEQIRQPENRLLMRQHQRFPSRRVAIRSVTD